MPPPPWYCWQPLLNQLLWLVCILPDKEAQGFLHQLNDHWKQLSFRVSPVLLVNHSLVLFPFVLLCFLAFTESELSHLWVCLWHISHRFKTKVLWWKVAHEQMKQVCKQHYGLPFLCDGWTLTYIQLADKQYSQNYCVANPKIMFLLLYI